MLPKISVIINCYNSETYLYECIESVITQTYENFEIIFWDNQSTDNSAQIVKSFNDNRIKYFFSPQHTALGLARNFAVAKASGEWIAFLDADDLWIREKLKRQVELINSSTSKLGLVYSKVNVISNEFSNKIMVDFYTKLIDKINEHSEINIFKPLLKGNYIIFSSLLVKKELFNIVGGIDSTLEQNEDYDLILKVSVHNTAICAGCLTSYRVHSSNTSIKNGIKGFEETDYILSSFPDFPFIKKAMRQNKTRFSLYLLLNKKYKEGVRLFIRDGDIIFALMLMFNKLKGK